MSLGKGLSGALGGVGEAVPHGPSPGLLTRVDANISDAFCTGAGDPGTQAPLGEGSSGSDRPLDLESSESTIA